ncbi:MAG: hypothetical protein KAQ91_03800 [Methylococcales bacterium]|nr:hypothetical protein [Methylococcales bacterium]
MKIKALFFLTFIIFSFSAFSAEHPELKAFPVAEEGMQRFVIILPHKERGEEDAFMVELIIGKEILTDGVNIYRLGNALERHTLQGWGYSYYQATGDIPIISTMMASPEGAPKIKKLVTAAPIKIRYNSRLPIVIYVPKNYEVRYRVWEASDSFDKALEG